MRPSRPLLLLLATATACSLGGAVAHDDGDDFAGDGLPPDVPADFAPYEPDEEGDQVQQVDEAKAFAPLDYATPLPQGKYHFAEPFAAPKLPARWVRSEAKKDGVDETLAKYDGRWEVTQPDTVVMHNDYMLKVLDRAKHHAVSAKLDRPFHFDGRPLVVQYDVQYQTGQECGGGYIKLLTKTAELDLKKFSDKTPYTIMFGPDKCGTDAKLHFIMRYRNPVNGSVNEHHSKKIDIADTVFSDHKTHLFTLVVNADGAYEVLVDQTSKIKANLKTDLMPPVEPPKEVADPDDSRPADWDEREKIADPAAVKPDDWDESAPEYIDDEAAVKPDDWDETMEELVADPEAAKPDDWDVEMDGEWEAPKIKNPACEALSGCGAWSRPQVKNAAYKGKWRPAMVANPDYKGKWQPKTVANPHWFDADPYKMESVAAVGIELWTMSDSILFDNLIVTDERHTADSFASVTWAVKAQQERASKQGDGVTGAVKGAFWGMVDAANEKPWLWAIYLVAVLLPIVLIAVFCFGAKSDDEEPASARRKKTDEPAADAALADGGGGDARAAADQQAAAEADDGDDDEEEEEEEDAEGEGHDTRPQTSKPVLRRRAAKKADLEQDESESMPSEESDDAASAGDKAAAAGGGKRRPRARKDQ